MLLDGSCIRSGRGKISERPRWAAGEDFNRRGAPIDCAGRVGALRRPDAAAQDLYHFRVNISAVLLAGGESRRMGRDKTNILFRGKPLWRVQLETLRKLQTEQIFISARTDPRWRPGDVTLVADIPPSRGPLSGLAASLDHMNTSHLLALAIDMPWMSNKYLESLCARIEAGRGVLPQIRGRAEPLAAIYPREAAIEARKALAGTDFSLRSLVRDLVAAGKLQIMPVTQQDEKFFRNMNEIADVESCSALQGGEV